MRTFQLMALQSDRPCQECGKTIAMDSDGISCIVDLDLGQMTTPELLWWHPRCAYKRFYPFLTRVEDMRVGSAQRGFYFLLEDL